MGETKPMNKIFKHLADCILLYLVFGVLFGVVLTLRTTYFSKIESQILCLKTHGAKKCRLEYPTDEVWNYCIQHNQIEDCGNKPY